MGERQGGWLVDLLSVPFQNANGSFKLSDFVPEGEYLVWMAPALQGLFDVVAAKSGTVLCPAC